MKTTIDIPDDILRRTKVAAAQRRTTLKNLVLQGLEKILSDDTTQPDTTAALERLEKGYQLGGKPLTRSEIYDR